jgi:O-antigen ligase
MVFTVMRTGSRGGGLALIALVPVLLWGLPWRRSLQFLLLGIPLAFGAWFTAPVSFRERMVSLFAGEEDYNQTDENGRIAIWKRGISYGVEHPVLGVGPGGFITQDGIGKAERGLQGKWSAAHNTYVQVFAEMGFPGLLLFLGLVASVWRVAWRAHRGRPGDPSSRRPEYLASLVAYLVAATFLSFLFYHMTWILLAGLATMAAGAVRSDGAGADAASAPSRTNRLRGRATPPASRVAPAPAGYVFERNSAR